ncbi:MAG: 30S ribosomal protein S21 [Bacteroidia bacterium]|jgi:small subunit ribosomal protein S21|nr:30S ribosomal protein S21 [Bacteroidia bacterium]
MLIINVKESESLDKALKKFKKKFEKTGVVKEMRSRQAFEKPCITKRMQRLRAAYKQQLQTNEMQG